MFRLFVLAALAAAFASPVAACAQQDACRTSMPQSMSMSNSEQGMSQLMDMSNRSFIDSVVHHATSGTSAEPDSTPAPMLMTMRGGWMLMLHGNAFLVDTQQTSPRGGDKLYSTNWIMPMAQRSLGPGVLTLRSMFSLEPATVTDRRYPLLFQQGETAYGRPIADGQHPHDFFMELGLLYDWRLSRQSLLSFYIAPVGDPAIGPTAYPHRASALENPVGTLGHHQEDSTHIAADVVTTGFTYGLARMEAGGFHGREPDEHRWGIEQGTIDSWSTRLTLQPGRDWSGQYSFAHIHSPEALDPGEDQSRMTASIMWNRPLAHGNLASSVIWGRTKSLPGNLIANSYLLESALRFARDNYASVRIESADRTNELVNGEQPLPANFHESSVGHVQAYTFGYDRSVPLLPHLDTALGAQFTAYGVSKPLRPIYGSDPVGYSVFLRIRPFGKSD